VFSVMAVVASVSANATAAQNEPPPPVVTTTPGGTTQAPGDDDDTHWLLDIWADILPVFIRIYNAGFDILSSVLVGGFNFLLRLIFGSIIWTPS